MRHARWSLVLCTLAACSFPPRGLPHDGGMDLTSGDGPTSCAAAATFVYVIGEDRRLSSFHPDTLTFDDVGTIICPAQLGAMPFSMAVDRHARAWVLYSSGELFQVDVTNAACSATSFVTDQDGFDTFGMGFVSDAAGSNAETLFIAGTSGAGESTLGTIDQTSLAVSHVATINDAAELTGTGAGALWAFFPDEAQLAQLDKKSGMEQSTISLPQLPALPKAWAMAFWGGDFWVFYEAAGDSSSSVYHVKADGTTSVALADTGRVIVGAGVSTCAPLVIP
jgi:hypothetical protein